MQKEMQEKERNYRADLNKYKKNLEEMSKIEADSKEFAKKNAELKAELDNIKKNYNLHRKPK